MRPAGQTGGVTELWDPIFGADAVRRVVDDRSWVRALCTVEAGLADALVVCDLIAPADAAHVRAACGAVADTDTGELGRAAQAGGNPVIPLVALLRRHVETAGGRAAAVHRGATSQDVVDTATMLVARDALALVVADLRACGEAVARLAAAYRDTAMIGRTLMQQAVPTTFGAVAAGWGAGLDRAVVALEHVSAGLAVQLGGAGGTLAAWYPHGPAVRAAFATALGLVDPEECWHTERTRLAALATALGTASGAVGKVALDIVLLAQDEIGEVREAAGGASSAMAHKHNPIAAITARAAAMQAPGLVATLLAAMAAELQRGAGPWHAEWLPLARLLEATGGAADRLRVSLTGLEVDVAALERNLATALRRTGETAPDVGHAPDLVDRYLEGRMP